MGGIKPSGDKPAVTVWGPERQFAHLSPYEPPRVYRRVKHSKGEPYDEETTHPRYPAELRERGVRLCRENRVNCSSGSAAYKAIAPKLGCSRYSLRVWCQQAERDEGKRTGLTTEEKDRIKDLERENKELRQANEILKKASAYFAPALIAASGDCRAMGRSSTARSANDLLH